jgi:5-methylcytosine-specific restriction protein A
MPTFPSGPCRWRGCPQRAQRDGLCEEHRRQRNREYNLQRKADPNSNSDFYRSPEWRALRKAYIQANPCCEVCRENGREVVATTVDHRVPIRQGGASLEWSNLQAMCTSCHSRKSAREGSRWGNRKML